MFVKGMQVKTANGKIRDVKDAEHLQELLDDGATIIPTIPASEFKPKDPKNLTKLERKMLRSRNLAGSLVIPEAIEVGEHDAKVVCFHQKKSIRTGNEYSACMLEVRGIRFSTLDNDETSELEPGDTLKIRIIGWVDGMTDKSGREIPKPNSLKVLEILG